MSGILFNAVSPYLRYAHEMTVYNDSYYYSENRYIAYDNRLVYCKKGEGGIMIDGRNYFIKSGSLLVWKAGLAYQYFFNADDPMEMLAFNFDYTKQSAYLDMPIPPDIDTRFHQSGLTETVTFKDAKAFNHPVLLESCEYLYPKLAEILTEFRNKKFFYTEKCSGLLVWVLSEIARSTMITKSETTGSTANSSQKADSIIQYLHEHYFQEITNELIGEIFHYHPYYINKLMVQNTGIPLHKYLQNYRISQAIHLIQTTDMPISKVCEAVGFNDFPHFSKYFKKITGRRPSDYRS